MSCFSVFLLFFQDSLQKPALCKQTKNKASVTYVITDKWGLHTVVVRLLSRIGCLIRDYTYKSCLECFMVIWWYNLNLLENDSLIRSCLNVNSMFFQNFKVSKKHGRTKRPTSRLMFFHHLRKELECLWPRTTDTRWLNP